MITAIDLFSGLGVADAGDLEVLHIRLRHRMFSHRTGFVFSHDGEDVTAEVLRELRA